MKTMYKITTPILCIALFPVFYFLPLIRVFISSSLSDKLMSSIGLKQYMSINYIVSSLSGSENESSLIKTLISTLNDSESTLGQLFTNKGYLIASIVCLAVTLVLILVIAGFAIFSKKYILTTGLTAGALVTLFATNKLFDAFAAPMISGEIGISSLISSASSEASSSTGLIGSLLGSLVSLDILKLSFAYSVAMFVLAIVLILGICAIVETRYVKK